MEATNHVMVCNKIDNLAQKQFTKVEIKNFHSTVDELTAQISQLLNLDRDSFDIICFGKTLAQSKSLDSYGINNGIILYLTKKKEPAFKKPQDPVTLHQFPTPADEAHSTQSQQMCIALRSALMNPLFRKVLENLSDFEKRENLMTINPELRTDPSLFGILSDPELLNTYINRANIKKVLQRYPYFLEVATNISATFHEESSSGSSFNLDSIDRSAFLNYSIDAPSDDEMDESETSSVSSNNTQNSASSSRITEHPNQSFSSMLFRAYQNRQQSGTAITPDMLRAALNTAPIPQPSSGSAQSGNSDLTSTVASTATSTPATQAPPNQSQSQQQRTTAQILIGWAPQLRQMRELGITDDIVAIQALEATGGDVQAAINIIFSDFN